MVLPLKSSKGKGKGKASDKGKGKAKGQGKPKPKPKSRADKLKALPDRAARDHVVAATLLNRGAPRRPLKRTVRAAPY